MTSTEGSVQSVSRFAESSANTDASISLIPPPSVPSNPPPPPGQMNPVNYGYEFRCEVEHIGSQLSFHPGQIDSYIAHTASHFLDQRPPPKTCVILCDQVFENFDDPASCWRERIRHIEGCFGDLARQGDVGTAQRDLTDLLRKRRNDPMEDYKETPRHTKRPNYDSLVGDCATADQVSRTGELNNVERRLILISNLEPDIVRSLEATREGNPPSYMKTESGLPYRSPSRSRSLETRERSSGAVGLLAFLSGLLMSSSFMWLNKRMDLYVQSLIMNKVTKSRTL
jgi:hypothetical protein